MYTKSAGYMVVVFVMMGLTGTAGAQQSGINNDVNLGIQLSQFPQDFGSGDYVDLSLVCPTADCRAGT